MIRFINGIPHLVPDDERITPELRMLRDSVNSLLRFLQGPQASHIAQQYREGILMMDNYDWFSVSVLKNEEA